MQKHKLTLFLLYALFIPAISNTYIVHFVFITVNKVYIERQANNCSPLQDIQSATVKLFEVTHLGYLPIKYFCGIQDIHFH